MHAVMLEHLAIEKKTDIERQVECADLESMQIFS